MLLLKGTELAHPEPFHLLSAWDVDRGPAWLQPSCYYEATSNKKKALTIRMVEGVMEGAWGLGSPVELSYWPWTLHP